MTPDLLNLMNLLGQNNQDSTFSSGQRYAQSIAGGENVPGMIAPGISYSSARPDGYTQADLNRIDAGPVPVMPSAPTQGNPLTIENQMPYAPPGVTTPERYTPMITNAESLKNLADLFNANLPGGNQVSFDPFIPGEPMAVDDLIPTIINTPPPVVDPVVNNLPSTGSSQIDFSFNPFEEIKPYFETMRQDPLFVETIIETPYNSEDMSLDEYIDYRNGVKSNKYKQQDGFMTMDNNLNLMVKQDYDNQKKKEDAAFAAKQREIIACEDKNCTELVTSGKSDMALDKYRCAEYAAWQEKNMWLDHDSPARTDLTAEITKGADEGWLTEEMHLYLSIKLS